MKIHFCVVNDLISYNKQEIKEINLKSKKDLINFYDSHKDPRNLDKELHNSTCLFDEDLNYLKLLIYWRFYRKIAQNEFLFDETSYELSLAKLANWLVANIDEGFYNKLYCNDGLFEIKSNDDDDDDTIEDHFFTQW